MVWPVWLWFQCSDNEQKVEGPKCLMTEIKELEELKEVLSDVIFKTFERELSENLESLST